MATNAAATAYQPPPHTATPTRRYDYLDSHEDDLPSYDDTAGAPAYSREVPLEQGRELDGSGLVFSLRQLGRKRQAYISMGPPMNVMRGPNHFTEIDSTLTPGHLDDSPPYAWQSTARRYNVDYKVGSRFHGQRPDFVVSVVDPQDQRRQSMPPPQRKLSFFGGSIGRDSQLETGEARRGSYAGTMEDSQRTLPIAVARFARSGPLPWTPRAQIVYDKNFIDLFGHEGHGLNDERQQDMKLQRPVWKVDLYGRRFGWAIGACPTRLVLVDLDTETEHASFVYSAQGSWASKDAEVGRLHVPLQALPCHDGEGRGRTGLQDGFMEFMVCSLTVVIQHWRNEGRMYSNEAPSGRGEGEIDAG